MVWGKEGLGRGAPGQRKGRGIGKVSQNNLGKEFLANSPGPSGSSAGGCH